MVIRQRMLIRDRAEIDEMGARCAALTRVGSAVDLSVDDRAEVWLRHVMMVADAGHVVDHDGLAPNLKVAFAGGKLGAL